MKFRSIMAVLLAATAVPAFAQAPNEEGLQFFEQKIRPVLVQHCYSCHSVQARDAKKLKGKLFLDSAEGVLDGGESGAVIVKGKSAESLLIKALKHDGIEMPPSGKLSAEIVADFAKWIDLGAPDPRKGDAPAKPKREISLDEGRKWWSFQPLKSIEPPAVAAGTSAASSIDRFVVVAQQSHGLKPNGPTTKKN